MSVVAPSPDAPPERARALRPVAGRLPAHDLDAEAAVLSACLLDAGALGEALAIVRPEHWYSDANRTIWAAIVELQRSGAAVDLVSVSGLLRGHKTLAAVGGPQYLGQIIDATPAVLHVADHAHRVAECWRQRRAVALVQRIAAEGYDRQDDAASWIARGAAELQALAEQEKPAAPLLTGPDLAVPLGPSPWIVPAMHFGPGRPVIVAGYGSSGKTLALQSLLLSVAAGIGVWAIYRVPAPFVVRHLDYEQGTRATMRRYQRLAHGLGLNLAELGDQIGVRCLPDMYLTSPGAEAALCRLCEGVQVVLLDSLRAACPGIDENESGIRVHLDLLTRISERTSVTWIVIHHRGKPSPERTDERMSVRGSSALFDAAGCVWTIAGTKGEPKLWQQQKTPADAEGGAAEDFSLRIEDVLDDEGTAVGVRLTHLAAAAAVRQQQRPEQALDEIAAEVLRVVQSQPGLSCRRLRALVPRRAALVDAALEMLEEQNDVRRTTGSGRGAGSRYYPTNLGQERQNEAD